MLSVPLLPPPIDSSPILPHTFRPRPDSPPPSTTTTSTANPQAARALQQRRDAERLAHNARSPLSLLTADESAIAARKHAIRNFGAYWIRPPGISKTLQAMNEEELERVEVAEQARQEQNLRDLEARQAVEEARARAEDQAAREGGEGEGMGEERDLDAEIPDADAAGGGEDGDVTAGSVSFNEESMVDGRSHLVEDVEEGAEEDEAVREAVEMEEAELTGAARDEEELGIERDLDDSVPEAGSYQHTDTEVEDSDSDSELRDSFAVQSTRRSARSARSGGSGRPLRAQMQGLAGLQERMRAQVSAADSLPRSPGSINLSSSVLESSFVGSSPVMQRGANGGRGRGRRRGRQS